MENKEIKIVQDPEDKSYSFYISLDTAHKLIAKKSTDQLKYIESYIHREQDYWEFFHLVFKDEFSGSYFEFEYSEYNNYEPTGYDHNGVEIRKVVKKICHKWVEG